MIGPLIFLNKAAAFSETDQRRQQVLGSYWISEVTSA